MRKHYPLNSAGAEDAGLLPWTDGVPNTGTEGSYPGHALVTDTEAEVLNAIGLFGLTQDGGDLTQLGQAIARGLYLGAFGGSQNALTASLPNGASLPALLPGTRLTAIPTQTNTGAVTVTLRGFATSPITLSVVRRDGSAAAAGDVVAGTLLTLLYDGTALRFGAPAPSEIAIVVNNTFNLKRIAGGVPFPFATPGTFSLAIDAGVTFTIGECRGGGGGGGGASDTSSVGSGGGGGSNSRRVLTTITATVLQIVVGAGGSGGAAGGGNGTTGGTSSVQVQSGSLMDKDGSVLGPAAVLCAATGGGPGLGAASGVLAPTAGSGGLATGGDLNDRGDGGGLAQGSFTNNTFIGGLGGLSPGSGGSPQANQGAAGNASSSPGTGGNGSSANAPGGNGAPGRVVIYK